MLTGGIVQNKEMEVRLGSVEIEHVTVCGVCMRTVIHK